MDPQLRWLRRFVVARTAERVAAEATLVAVLATIGAVGAGASAMGVLLTPIVVAPATAALRIGLALTTNPITARYLLQWTNPSVRLHSAAVDQPMAPDDPVTRELRTGSFAFLTRLERSDAPAVGLEVSRAEGGQLLVTRGDDGEITVLSRLDDGRLLATSSGFVPPTERLVTQRGGDRPGQIPTDTLIEHVERLLTLREAGVEAIDTTVDDVLALADDEWRGWQEIGPFVGPLVAVGWRRWPRLALQVDVPDELIWQRSMPATAAGTRSRGRPEALTGRDTPGVERPLVGGRTHGATAQSVPPSQ